MKKFMLFFMVIAALTVIAPPSRALDFTLKTPAMTAATPEESVPDEEKPAAKKVSVSSLISAVRIKGNLTVPSDKILASISSIAGDGLSQEKVRDDTKSIYAMGVFSDVQVSFEKTKKGTVVIYTVKENPLLKGITIIGNSAFSTTEILATIETRTGQLISYRKIQDDLKKIDDMYHNSGYMLERVVDVSTDAERSVITIKIIEGQIESIVLDGNNSTKDYVILREMKSKAGTVLNEKLLTKDLKRVFNLGYFSDVAPDFLPGADPNKIILVMKVKESKTNTLNFGGGYGEREGWFGFVDFNAENLLGTGQGVLLRGQAGQQQQTYQLRYTYPWLFPDKLGDRVMFSFRRWLTIGKNVYLLETTEREGMYNGWEVGLNKQFTDEWNAGVTLGSEKVTPTGTATFDPYTADTIGLSLSYDTRDNWMNPTKGQYYVFGLRRGWKYSTAWTSFTKYTADLNQFVKLGEHGTLAGHMGLGFGLGDIPVSEIFYAGGANTIRGYEPIEARTGKKRLLLNVEYRLTFNDMFQGVIFYDWGNAWEDGWPDTFNFISGRGFGIRLNTPMGPIRLDYGIGANRAFSEGVLHFSIGQAF